MDPETVGEARRLGLDPKLCGEPNNACIIRSEWGRPLGLSVQALVERGEGEVVEVLVEFYRRGRRELSVWFARNYEGPMFRAWRETTGRSYVGYGLYGWWEGDTYTYRGWREAPVGQEEVQKMVERAVQALLRHEPEKFAQEFSEWVKQRLGEGRGNM